MAPKNPKVLIFSLTYLPFIGGAEIALKEITDRVKDFEFHLITAKFNQRLPSEELLGNLHLWRVGQGNKLDKYLYPFRACFLANKLQATNNYNLAWAMLETWGGLAALFFKLRHSKIKYLLTMQSGDSDWFIKIRTWFWWPLYKMVYTKADHLQAISHWLADRARQYGYKKEISVVPNGVDLKKFRIDDFRLQIDKIKNNLNIPADHKIILTNSRLVKKNGVADLVKAFHLLVAGYKLPVAKLVILGAGPLENELKKLAKRLRVQDKIIFLGVVPYDQIQDYYAIADVFVRPSLSEGFGNVFIEAMAAGLPVIATPVGGIPDFLKDGETGWFCQPKNPKSIAEKIEYILDKNSRAEVERVVVHAQQVVEEQYSWDLLAEKMKNIFNSLI